MPTFDNMTRIVCHYTLVLPGDTSAPATKPYMPFVPPLPRLGNPLAPSTADLLMWATHMDTIASQCDVTKQAHEPNNPYAAVGAFKFLSEKLREWLAVRVADEESNLLLTDRFRHEAAIECAHERLMSEDGDYAAEFEAEIGGDDE